MTWAGLHAAMPLPPAPWEFIVVHFDTITVWP
jgi:hypothetical protein